MFFLPVVSYTCGNSMTGLNTQVKCEVDYDVSISSSKFESIDTPINIASKRFTATGVTFLSCSFPAIVYTARSGGGDVELHTVCINKGKGSSEKDVISVTHVENPFKFDFVNSYIYSISPNRVIYAFKNKKTWSDINSTNNQPGENIFDLEPPSSGDEFQSVLTHIFVSTCKCKTIVRAPVQNKQTLLIKDSNFINVTNTDAVCSTFNDNNDGSISFHTCSFIGLKQYKFTLGKKDSGNLLNCVFDVSQSTLSVTLGAIESPEYNTKKTQEFTPILNQECPLFVVTPKVDPTAYAYQMEEFVMSLVGKLGMIGKVLGSSSD